MGDREERKTAIKAFNSVEPIKQALSLWINLSHITITQVEVAVQGSQILVKNYISQKRERDFSQNIEIFHWIEINFKE